MYRFRNKRMSTRCSASTRYVPIFVFETNECLPGVLHRALLALLVRVTVYGLGFSGLGFGKGHMSNVRPHVNFFFVWPGRSHVTNIFLMVENSAFFNIFISNYEPGSEQPNIQNIPGFCIRGVHVEFQTRCLLTTCQFDTKMTCDINTITVTDHMSI